MDTHLKPVMPGVLHFILNTECNAYGFKSVDGYSEICGFCYRSTKKVIASKKNIEKLLKMIKQESEVSRIVFTGGEPLIQKNNYIAFAVEMAKSLGFEVNIHTNGLCLFDKYSEIGKWVDVFTLAIDGSCSRTADWKRGVGFFEHFIDNVKLLINDKKTIAFNTFVDSHNFFDLDDMAKMISGFTKRTKIEYWLISQYRPTVEDVDKKNSFYCFSPSRFKARIEKIVKLYPQINIYSQPTRENESYPIRIWLFVDGFLTVDTGNHHDRRHVVVGNCFKDGFKVLYKKAFKIRDGRFL